MKRNDMAEKEQKEKNWGENGSEEEKRTGKEREDGKEKSIWGNLGVKIFLFLLSLVSFTVMGGCFYLVLRLEDSNYFRYNRENFLRSALTSQIWRDYFQWSSFDLDLDHMEFMEDIYGDEVGLELTDIETGEIIWADRKGEDALYTFNISRSYLKLEGEDIGNDEQNKLLFNEPYNVYYYNYQIEDEYGDLNVLEGRPREELTGAYKEYRWTFYISPDIYFSDGIYHSILVEMDNLYSWGDMVVLVFGISVLVFLVSFILLMISVGHKNGVSGIAPSHLWGIPMDIFIVGWCAIAVIGIAFLGEFIRFEYLVTELYIFTVFAAIEGIFGLIFSSECINRLKRHTFLKSMLIYKICVFFAKQIARLIKNINHMAGFLLVFFAFCFYEMILLIVEDRTYYVGIVFVLWIFEKLIMLAGIAYLYYSFNQIKSSSEALAGGRFDYKLDTSRLILGYKKIGDNLNNIASGMNAAVEERLKSERLKTELITNVSHDLKTPLTSIINYSALIINAEENGGDVGEYAGVLNRQSKRLKKLLDDLLEASKAATGNIEVHPEPCEIRVMLTQAIGEYEDKFREKGLVLVEKHTDETVRIMADGRCLWRIFDNLMNNIYKYAMENSRVYLNMERNEDRVDIIFRNMSKYELDVSSEELTERFVRGDKSRNMEGNGLGLSIASSLTSIQNGTIKIVTDGDLFKVVVSFPIIN